MKPRTDLSTRSNGIVKPPSSPVFSRRNSNPTSTLTFAAAGSQPLYKAPGSITVLWILFQVQSATTVQLFKNGEALSASYQLNAGAIVRYAGLLLLGNETLSLSVSGACVVTYEIAWVKEHDERLITTDTTISNPSTGSSGGSVTVTNFPATQPVSGSVAVSNLPATQPVSGTVAVSNFPVTQPVSGFPGQYPIADTLGNQFLSDSAGNQRINPYGSTGSFKAKSISGPGNTTLTLTVPVGKKWIIKHGLVKVTASATVASRSAAVNATDTLGNFLISCVCGVVTTASQSTFYTYGPGVPLSTAFVQLNASVPMPEVVLGPGLALNIQLLNGVAADTILATFSVIEFND